VRNTARLTGAVAGVVSALAVIASYRNGVVDRVADVLLVGSLLALADAVFRLVEGAGGERRERNGDRGAPSGER
jgi:hypothetical protein